MNSCRPRYRLVDLVFAFFGAGAFLADLCADLWTAAVHLRAGRYQWCGQVLGLLVFSSGTVQIFSWAWYKADRAQQQVHGWLQPPPPHEQPPHELQPPPGQVAELQPLQSAELQELELEFALPQVGEEEVDTAQQMLEAPGPAQEKAAVVRAEAERQLLQDCGQPLQDEQEPQPPQEWGRKPPPWQPPPQPPWQPPPQPPWQPPPQPPWQPPPQPPWQPPPQPPWQLLPQPPWQPPPQPEQGLGDLWQGLPPATAQQIFTPDDFISFPLLSSDRGLALVHLFQLGYLLRCLHALEVGIKAYKKNEKYTEYAYFLIQDITMLRLFETFLENTPQLTLMLYVILHNNKAEIYQYVSLSVSFLSIAWALLDYHQALRFFLKDKHKLELCASCFYFLWNLFLICPRIIAIAFFAAAFQCYVILHLLLVWFGLFIWVELQKTDFMKHPAFEHFYRAVVAVILYFCWFNVAEGRTLYRSIIYYSFITTDSLILLLTWWFYRDPFTTDTYAQPAFLAALVCLVIGILVRIVYYLRFHPNTQRKLDTCYDEVDYGREMENTEFRSLDTRKEPRFLNQRMYQLSQNLFTASSLNLSTSRQTYHP